MKRKIMGLMAILAMAVACQKNESITQETDTTLYATMEEVASTRTMLDDNNNVLWSEGDQIVAFMKTSLGLKYQVTPESVGKTAARFTKLSPGNQDDLYAGSELSHNVAYYPYSDIANCMRSGENYEISVILPTEQTYTANSFGNGSLPMVAVSEDNKITFRNVCGGMKLQLKGTQKVASIKVEGKKGELLSGAATITAYTDDTKPTITMASSASASLTLNCGSGVQLNESTSTEFIIALPPVLFSKGFTVTVTDDASRTYTVETDKANTVLRSSLLVMPEISIDASSDEEEEPQEGDYVDEYGINHRQGVEIDGVVWAPVNCGYHATDYKYGKLYQWGRKYGQGYDSSDASVPELVAGPVSLATGQSKDNENKFYYNSSSPWDWCDTPYDNLWNSGTEDNPVKTEYDPCPSGWRVPTYAELEGLIENYSSWTTDKNGQSGYWFSGASSYTETVSQVFFPAVGALHHLDGRATSRGTYGGYWSSCPDGTLSKYLTFLSNILVSPGSYERACGNSVRCVQE